MNGVRARYMIPTPAKNAMPEFRRIRFCPVANSRLGAGSCDIASVQSNDRVERPATMTVPRPDAAHHAPRSARTRC